MENAQTPLCESYCTFSSNYRNNQLKISKSDTEDSAHVPVLGEIKETEHNFTNN